MAPLHISSELSRHNPNIFWEHMTRKSKKIHLRNSTKTSKKLKHLRILKKSKKFKKKPRAEFFRFFLGPGQAQRHHEMKDYTNRFLDNHLWKTIVTMELFICEMQSSMGESVILRQHHPFWKGRKMITVVSSPCSMTLFRGILVTISRFLATDLSMPRWSGADGSPGRWTGGHTTWKMVALLLMQEILHQLIWRISIFREFFIFYIRGGAGFLP